MGEQVRIAMEPGVERTKDNRVDSAIASTEASNRLDKPSLAIARASLDIGSHADTVMEDGRELNTTLRSSEQGLLCEIEENIGARQVTRKDLESVTDWLIRRDMDQEVEENWSSVTEEVETQDIPDDSKLLSTHFVFKIKKTEQGVRKLKERLAVHGNRDYEKDEVRKDAIAADMMMNRVVIALGLIMGFELGVADIKDAFMQSGPAQRDIYIIPPKTYRNRRMVYWKLLALAYGVCDAGQQWLKTSDTWITKDVGMRRLAGAHQLSVKRDTSDKLILIVAKTTDEFRISGSKEIVEAFIGQMKERFVVGKAIIEPRMKFNGFMMDIEEDGGVRLSMSEYLGRLAPIELSRNRRKELNVEKAG